MRLLIVLCVAATAAVAQNPDSDYDTYLHSGIQAYRSARYAEAVTAFQRAVDAKPNDVAAHNYLAAAYMTQYVPGARSPENQQVAANAEREFKRTLELEPKNAVAIASLASINFQEANALLPLDRADKLDEAKGWYERLVEVSPNNKEAYYSLGVIAWTRSYWELRKAREEAGLKAEDKGPLPNRNARLELATRFSKTIEEATENLQRALALDPKYADAMAYMNLVLRERADLRDTPEEYARDIAQADEWAQKALASKSVAGPQTTPANGMVQAPAPSDTPSRCGPDPSVLKIRVGGRVLEANLIQKVEPVYPALAKQARVQGTVRFNIKVDADGKIDNLQLISGHPLLVQAAKDAVMQWTYKPTLINGRPACVISTVDVNFTLTN